MKNLHSKIDLPIQTRLAGLEQSSATDNNERLFNVIFTTGAAVRRYDFFNDESYDEELSVDKNSVRLGRLNTGAPVLDTHSQRSLENVIGVVVPGSAKIENGLGRATIKLDGGEENASIIRKIKDGIIQNISVGYRVHKFEVIQRDGEVPVYRAVDWEPHEVSLVPIGADAGAGVRSNPETYPCEIFQPKLKENKMPEAETTTKPNLEANNNPGNNDPASNPDLTTEVRGAEDETAEGVQRERSRVLEIQKIVRVANLPESFATRMIADGHSLKKTRKKIIDELAKRGGEGGEIRSQIAVTGDDPMIQERAFIENSLLHKHNPKVYKLDEGGRQYRGLSLMEIGREILTRRGLKIRGLSKSEVAGLCLGLEVRGGLLGTSDFPNILANVANKTLRTSYEAAPQTFKPFTKQKTAADFKTISRTQLSDAPSLQKVNESGEFQRGKMSDAAESYKLATYGEIVAITRQTIINDDLDAFTDLPAKLGSAAADLESDTVWGIVTANAALADSVALFDPAHNNLAGSGAVISVTTLSAAKNALRQQKSLQGRPINLMPAYLIVPSALETVAQQYTTQTTIIYTKSSDYNPFANTLQVIAEPRLDGNSVTAWYMSADTGRIDTIEYCYLEGEEGAYLESRVGFDVDGVELKVRLDFAAKAIDYRGLYKNPGA